jgi:hypothetical protein
MAKIHDDMPTDAVGARDSAPGKRSTATPPGPPTRGKSRFGLGYAVGLVIAIVVGIGIVLVAVLPGGTPRVLPLMSNSLGFWDHIPTSVPATPAIRSHSQAMAAYDRQPAVVAASAPAPLETFRYSSQPALNAPVPATHVGLETFRSSGQPAPHGPAPAMSTSRVSLGSITSDR